MPCVAGRARFELARAFYTLLVFETSTFNHSVISPDATVYYTRLQGCVKVSDAFAAAPHTEVNIGGNRVSPSPAVGAASPPHREGLGGLRPPKNKNIFILGLCAPRMTV